jgi:hypothetical protein
VSHIAKVGCQVTDLEALGTACASKGAELRIGQKRFRSYSGGVCEHAIRLLDNPAAYEVGLVRSGDVWDLAWDNWDVGGQALQDRFGAGLMGLQNEYLAVVAEDQLRREGFMVQRVDEGAQIHLQAYE